MKYEPILGKGFRLRELVQLPQYLKKTGDLYEVHLFVSAHGTQPYNPDSLVNQPLPYNPDSIVHRPLPYNPHSTVNRAHPLKTTTSPTITLALKASEISWALNRTGGVGG
jgi:hypothetical protein